MRKKRTKLLSLFLAFLFLIPSARMALAEDENPILNEKCDLSDWPGFCNYPIRLMDNRYKSGADLRKGSKAGIYWTSDVPVGIVYWEWIVPPDECRYTFVDENREPISTSIRYREGDRGYLTVPEGARGIVLEVISGYSAAAG